MTQNNNLLFKYLSNLYFSSSNSITIKQSRLFSCAAFRLSCFYITIPKLASTFCAHPP